MRHRKTLISAAILLAIALHAVPAVYSAERSTLWPFMTWTMYYKSKAPGPIETIKKRVLAVTANGQQEEVDMHLVGLGPAVLAARYFRPMWAGDSAAARELIRRLNPGRTDPVVELRMESETYTVTDSGVARHANPVIIYPAESR